MISREFILNENCLLNPFNTTESAEAALIDLVTGIASLTEANVAKNILRFTETFYSAQIASSFTILEIVHRLNKQPEFRDVAVFLLTLSTKKPLSLTEEIENRLQLIDYIEGIEHKGSKLLLLCLVDKYIAVSLPTEPWWDTDLLKISAFELEQNEERKEHHIEVDHLSRSVHATTIIIRHQNLTQKELTRKNFWEMRKMAFPYLDFAPSVEANIRDIEISFSSIVRCLSSLNDTSAEWNAQELASPQYKLDKSPESATTMSNPALKKMRIFRDTNGMNQAFELHAGYSDVGRIHWREKHSEKRIEIGYIGRHLPTTLYR